jgi:hypothetical protein
MAADEIVEKALNDLSTIETLEGLIRVRDALLLFAACTYHGVH